MDPNIHAMVTAANYAAYRRDRQRDAILSPEPSPRKRAYRTWLRLHFLKWRIEVQRAHPEHQPRPAIEVG
ncbi:MAG: hypothetical protein CL607_11885 [Anaerolineaceae bacterium]|nr:hypothetical protein [Anaerolineaceae bacterium]